MNWIMLGALSTVLIAIAAILNRRVESSPVSGVTRGDASWAYIYLTFGFALTLEAGIIALIAPLRWPFNLLAYALVSGSTVYLWLFNGWFQNKLLEWKARYEQQSHHPHRKPVLGCTLFALAFLWLLIVAAVFDAPSARRLLTPGGCAPPTEVPAKGPRSSPDRPSLAAGRTAGLGR